MLIRDWDLRIGKKQLGVQIRNFYYCGVFIFFMFCLVTASVSSHADPLSTLSSAIPSTIVPAVDLVPLIMMWILLEYLVVVIRMLSFLKCQEVIKIPCLWFALQGNIQTILICDVLLYFEFHIFWFPLKLLFGSYIFYICTY